MAGLCAVIGGSGLYELDEQFQIESSDNIQTPYGNTSAELRVGDWQGCRVAFMPRHGASHQIPPHKINYRANLWALQSIGVSHIIAANAVGGIDPRYAPLTLGLPDQIIDYTSNREHTFFDGKSGKVEHVDFTRPYSQRLRETIIQAAKKSHIDLIDGGTYGCTNGPRLETTAEITKIRVDGCNIVGMTGMPEAALARELGMEYASIVLVVNWCAGITDKAITMDEIKKVLQRGVGNIRQLILQALPQVGI